MAKPLSWCVNRYIGPTEDEEGDRGSPLHSAKMLPQEKLFEFQRDSLFAGLRDEQF
jgi:hypothetical protein